MAANGGFRVICRGFVRGVAWEAEENDGNRVGYDFLGFIKIFCELGLVAWRDTFKGSPRVARESPAFKFPPPTCRVSRQCPCGPSRSATDPLIALRLLRYLKKSPGRGLFFQKGNGSDLVSYVDSDWELQIPYNIPISLFCDNSGAISIAANLVFHEKTKHFELDLHFVREKIVAGVFRTEKVSSVNLVADIFTKGLSTVQHDHMCDQVGLIDMFTT
ncbi:hypothetical protein E3N88_34922 [Mikania micrantha]|uniref:Reverse transcriptase Ty1/copia-type domain-containing protein n=1 Tax=Mikania micrantha TaxID=192012 RepID=A0A5N6LZW1_9ASTR|nr:hypothetical protein E3N88_34922 [Mikania micrantha]